MNRLTLAFLIVFFSIQLIACSAINPQPTEDTSYLTPIPEATRRAFKYTLPITTKLQAVMFALGARGLHFGFVGTPKVISVEEVQVSELVKQGISNGNDLAEDTKVWLVVLEGEIQTNPPDPLHIVTPPPPFHGCNYVILQESVGVKQIGGINCPLK